MSLANLTGADIDHFRNVFTWHPSEASGLLRPRRTALVDSSKSVTPGIKVAYRLDDQIRVVDAKRAATITPANRLGQTTSLMDTEVVHTHLNEEATMLVVEWWTRTHGPRRIERQ